MKFYVNFYSKKQLLGIFFIILLSINNINTLKAFSSKNNIKYQPSEIVKMHESIENDKKIDIDLSESDPLEYMKRKEELINLYLKGKQSANNMRFRESGARLDVNENRIESEKSNTFYLTKPASVTKKGEPVVKEYHNEEEVVKIKDVFADSNYVEQKVGQTSEVFEAGRILLEDNKFWCSEGNHKMDTSVNFIIEFDRSYRISAFWIHWAFAPGMYKVSYSNKKELDNYDWVKLSDWRNSIKGADNTWWKNVISNPKTRWNYKAFDERVNLDEPTWAKFMKIEMKMPVNQYFGIYKLEFYIKSKAVVMLKSRKPGEELCISVVNGVMANNSPVIMLDCLQALSYGDNRELFVIHSNGFITTYNSNKCLQSALLNRVDILDCGQSSDFKDDREKWILDYDGKIRSMKAEFTCLTVTDFSISDEISINDVKLSATNTQSDGLHNAERAMGDDINLYWATNPVKDNVIYEMFFYKYPYIVKDMQIDWKFPAKTFDVEGLFTDGFWKIFKKMNNNRETTTIINFMNQDLNGIRIVMKESTTKVEESYVYGIRNIILHTGGRYLSREPCKNILLDSNLFEIIDVNILDQVTGHEYNKAQTQVRNSRSKFVLLSKSFSNVPDTLVRLNDNSLDINSKFITISNGFKDILMKLSKFENLLSEELKLNTIATSEHFAANSCADIIKAFPSKRSGMYWIKNECMAVPQLVYCDFDSYDKKGGLDFLIYNENQPHNTPLKFKTKKLIDVRYICYQLGMEPIQIKNDKILKTIYYLLNILKYDLNSDNVIPIAYDYNCDVSKCSETFRSFDDQSSGDISDIIKHFNEEYGSSLSNLFKGMSEFDDINRNIAAFGKTGNIVFENLGRVKVSAIVCSTNQDGILKKKNYIDVDCDTNLRLEEFTSIEIFSSLRMYCPSDCARVNTAQVFGTGIYTDNSSICRAAIHSGAKKDNVESVVEVHFEPGKEKYLGSDVFNVKTLDYTNAWNRSFTVKKYDPYCPINKVNEYHLEADDATTFLELSEDVYLQDNLFNEKNNKELLLFEERKTDDVPSSFLELSDKMSLQNSLFNENNNQELIPLLEEKLNELKLIKKLQTAIAGYQNLVDVDRSFLTNSKQRELVEKMGKISRFLQEDIANKIKSSHVLSDKTDSSTGPGILNNMRLASVNNLRSNNLLISNPTNNIENTLLNYDQIKSINENKLLEKALSTVQNEMLEQKQIEQVKKYLGFQIPRTGTTTETGLTYISALYTRRKTFIEQLEKMGAEFKGLIGNFRIQIEKLYYDKELGINNQTTKFLEFESKTTSILKFVFEIDRKIQNKLKRTEFNVKKARDKITEQNIREQFTEDYVNTKINENWWMYESKNGKGNPPEWSYFQYFINSHYKVIQQKGGFMDNRTGAHLILKLKDYYDFELKFSFLLKGNQTFGIAFRYIDPYNYYIFEVSNLEKGIKRFRKFKGGNAEELDIKNDGGYIEDTWYNVKIRARQSKFKIYMTDYSGPDLDTHYELVFKVSDNELVHGTIAFASQGIRYMLLDNISIIPIECTNFDEIINEKIVTLTSTCTRFVENYKNGFYSRWKIFDPEDSMDGPSIWKLFNNVENREIVLTQQSMIYGTSEFQESSIFLLNDQTKICTSGRFIIRIKPLDEGFVGLVFRYNYYGENGKSSYYILEISGIPGENFVRIRKKIDNKFSLVSINPILGYTKNQWFKIILTLDNNNFNAFITNKDSSDTLIKVFQKDVIDEDIKYGLMGISTYKTKVLIDDIVISPFDNLDPTEGEENLLYVDEEELDLPKNKIKETSIFDRINTHIKNFTWSKCLLYPIYEDRKRYCNILFSSSNEIDMCKSNFCNSCCTKMVDNTNKENIFLCSKQCSSSETGSNKNSWESCVESMNPETSPYPYCDEHFNNDFFSMQRCKVDMCNLCCISSDQRHIPLFTDGAINACYKKCGKAFNVKPTK